jgi:GTPase SAR1 family protein
VLRRDKDKPVTYKENYIEALRKELVGVVESEITPIALNYRYSETPLEENIKWRPIVLLLGNYSSGKSTLINELLDVKVQTTGQAPTDDSFTVITYKDPSDDGSSVETRDGKVLLNDNQYPFASLRRHGQRFAAHFRLKKVSSPFLQNLALIDTPGMVDSVSERDRGYDYQEVIGDLASIADLILVLFDPHKAGTIRETYESLRRTLPKATYEDRVLFVLNRIDECTNLNDLLRVYGTLCWNLSQMTGRKDIPLIHLTYSTETVGTPKEFLKFLDNQRDELKRSILEAPTHRLDHLATYIEEHGDTLSHYLEALVNYGKRRRAYAVKSGLLGLLLGLVIAVLVYTYASAAIDGPTGGMTIGSTVVAFGLVLGMWAFFEKGYLLERFHRRQMSDLDVLTPLDWQSRRDSWERVKPLVKNYLERTRGKFGVNQVCADHRRIRLATEKASRESRSALSEIERLPAKGS